MPARLVKIEMPATRAVGIWLLGLRVDLEKQLGAELNGAGITHDYDLAEGGSGG
jgi:hypothetical protein